MMAPNGNNLGLREKAGGQGAPSLDRSIALYQAVLKHARIDAALRKQIDALRKKADLVTQDDAIETSGALVRAGLPASFVAGMLADMPEGGAALQTWVERQSRLLAGDEFMVGTVLRLVRHRMGVEGLKALGRMPPPESFGGGALGLAGGGGQAMPGPEVTNG
jgi:hypothetical protein